jgi:hypothetical protein
MKKLRNIAAVAVLLLTARGLQAQMVPTFDLQSFIQLLATKAIGQAQLNSLGQLVGLNGQQLNAANQINLALGNPDSSQLAAFNLGGLQSVLQSVPGLANINVSSLFPSGVGSAFLGLDYNTWQNSVGSPSNQYGQQLQRAVVGDVVTQAGLPPDESAFLQDLASPGSYLARNQTALALSVGRLLASHLLSSLQTQAQQSAVYAAQKQQFDTQAQQNLTLVDRAKLNNNQNTLSLDLQLQQMQAQSLSNSAQATQLDAQNQLLQQQIEREDVDRAASSNSDW